MALSIDALVNGVRSGQRAILAQAITLVESTHPRHREQASQLLSRLTTDGGDTQRIGITGVPGAGKSTFIETLGMQLISEGHRVAVLAVDPSSTRSGGSILADKTRMAKLTTRQEAFIRPSPSRGNLGGVARMTRETITLVEAAGFDVVLIETVGVGQSETMVSDMVDFFLVLMIAGAGDEFQGIKKGILELADLIAVNKADGEGEPRAHQAAAAYRSALHMIAPVHPDWRPPVMACSAHTGAGLDTLWGHIQAHRRQFTLNGGRDQKRKAQQLRWVDSMVTDALIDRFQSHPAVAAIQAETQAQVRTGQLSPSAAVEQLLAAFAG